MKKRILTPEHFRNKPICWWPERDLGPDDDFVFSKLKDKKSLKIIEIGSGRGRLTFPISELGHEVHAVEINRKFISYCKKKNIKNIYFYNKDAKELPFEDGTFDFALLIEVIMHLPDPLKVLKELNRILKSDGKLILMFIRKYTASYFITSFKVITNLYKYDFDYKFHSWHEIKKLLDNSGFEIIEIYNKKSGIPYIFTKKI